MYLSIVKVVTRAEAEQAVNVARTSRDSSTRQQAEKKVRQFINEEVTRRTQPQIKSVNERFKKEKASVTRQDKFIQGKIRGSLERQRQQKISRINTNKKSIRSELQDSLFGTNTTISGRETNDQGDIEARAGQDFRTPSQKFRGVQAKARTGGRLSEEQQAFVQEFGDDPAVQEVVARAEKRRGIQTGVNRKTRFNASRTRGRARLERRRLERGSERRVASGRSPIDEEVIGSAREDERRARSFESDLRSASRASINPPTSSRPRSLRDAGVSSFQGVPIGVEGARSARQGQTSFSREFRKASREGTLVGRTRDGFTVQPRKQNQRSSFDTPLTSGGGGVLLSEQEKQGLFSLQGDDVGEDRLERFSRLKSESTSLKKAFVARVGRGVQKGFGGLVLPAFEQSRVEASDTGRVSVVRERGSIIKNVFGVSGREETLVREENIGGTEQILRSEKQQSLINIGALLAGVQGGVASVGSRLARQGATTRSIAPIRTITKTSRGVSVSRSSGVGETRAVGGETNVFRFEQGVITPRAGLGRITNKISDATSTDVASALGVRRVTPQTPQTRIVVESDVVPLRSNNRRSVVRLDDISSGEPTQPRFVTSERLVDVDALGDTRSVISRGTEKSNLFNQRVEETVATRTFRSVDGETRSVALSSRRNLRGGRLREADFVRRETLKDLGFETSLSKAQKPFRNKRGELRGTVQNLKPRSPRTTPTTRKSLTPETPGVFQAGLKQSGVRFLGARSSVGKLPGFVSSSEGLTGLADEPQRVTPQTINVFDIAPREREDVISVTRPKNEFVVERKQPTTPLQDTFTSSGFIGGTPTPTTPRPSSAGGGGSGGIPIPLPLNLGFPSGTPARKGKGKQGQLKGFKPSLKALGFNLVGGKTPKKGKVFSGFEERLIPKKRRKKDLVSLL